MTRAFRPGEAEMLIANPLRGPEPTYTLDRQVAEARREMGEKRWAELNREWHEAECDRREAVWEASKELAGRNGGLGA
jgi:hypothetical protein